MRNSKALESAALRFIAQQQAEQHDAVAVVWQRSTEDDDCFAQRALTARGKLHRSQLLVCVCAKDAVPRSAGIVVVELPPVMLGLFDRPARYRGCFGGRGAGRSWSFARALLVRSLEQKTRILCARELQNSIAD